MRANEAFRIYARLQGVKLFEIAEKLHMAPSYFSRRYMTRELEEKTEEQLRLIVDAIAAERRP